jgi:hypothetical protein
MRIENTSCSPLLAWFDKLTIRGFDWLTVYGFDTSTRLSAGFALAGGGSTNLCFSNDRHKGPVLSRVEGCTGGTLTFIRFIIFLQINQHSPPAN